LKKFRDDKQFDFDLLSDFNKDVARAYRVLYETFPIFHMKGVTKRAAFVIDQQGLIQYVDILDNPGELPDFKQLEEALSQCSQE